MSTSKRRPSHAGLSLACAALGAAACLDPQVSDQVPHSGLVLPPSTEVPWISEDRVLEAQVAASDGVDELVPRITAFAGGRVMHYWSFGPTSDIAAPMLVLYDPAQDALIAGSGIIDTLPGDPGYSPFRALMRVPITRAYQGEVIPSVSALEEARQMGLVGSPELTNLYINCPVVAESVRLDLGARAPPLEPHQGYYRGQRVAWFDIAALLEVDPQRLDPGSMRVPVAELYRLRREGGELLAEPARGVDITGDDDLHDTNDIYGPGDSLGDPLQPRRVVIVTVPAQYSSIDTARDETMANFRWAEDLFVMRGGRRMPVSRNVVSVEDTGELVNRPFRQVREPGSGRPPGPGRPPHPPPGEP